MHTRLTQLFLLSSASIAAMAAHPAMAQDAPAQATAIQSFEEIVVTARRRAESLQDVPGTVTALTQATIQGAGIQRVEDFIQLTPGVSIINSAEVGDTQVNIRGINGARDAENSFAFIIDGVLYSNPAAFNREYADLQQIEIFKGPQGAIYGRNAAAGAILVTTQKPGDELEVMGKASFANDESYFAQARVSGPLVENELFFSVSGDYRTTDGFYRNQFQNNAAIVDRYEGFNIHGRLLWEPSDDLAVDTKVRYGEVDASSITFNATFHLPVFAQAFGSPAAFEDVNEHEFVFQPNIVSDNDQTAFEFSTKADYDMDWATLTGWFLFSDIDNNLISDGTSAAFGFFNADPVCQATTAALNAQGVTLPPPQILGTTPVPIIFTPDFSGSFFGPYTPTTCDGIQEQVRNQQDISLELRLASPDDQALRWMGGFYALDIDRQVGVSLNRDSGDTPIRGLLQTSGPNRTEALVFDDFDSRIYAVFGQVEYDITNSLEASIALRWDREKRKVSSLVPTDLTSTVIDLNGDGIFNDPLNPGLSDLVNPSGVLPDQERTFKELQPKISLTWEPNDNVTLFANWGVGFKAGGFNNQGSAATVDIFINNAIAPFTNNGAFPLVDINDQFEKETSSAFEAGFKTRFWGGRARFEAAAYYVDVDNMQFFEFFVGSFGLLRVVSNIDNVDLYGFEASGSVQLHDYVTVFGGINITDSEIKANAARPDTLGNKSPATPDYTGNVGAQFDYPIDDGLSLFARVDGTFVGPTWFHTVQNQQRPTIFQGLFEIAPVTGPGSGGLGIGDFSNTRRDAYALLNIRAGVQGDWWSVIGFVENATGTKYLEDVIPATEFGGSFNAPGTRARYGVEVMFRF
ncbi:MAG: TonB-dependent receptor [Sphingomonadales bacterium]